MDENIEYILGGIAALHSELEKANTWLRKLYDIEMTVLAHTDEEVFTKLNMVHNQLNMFMDQDWESKL